ncbi:MAG: hypothetical protein ACT4PV_03740 [Planctomycetaceae bacterium]
MTFEAKLEVLERRLACRARRTRSLAALLLVALLVARGFAGEEGQPKKPVAEEVRAQRILTGKLAILRADGTEAIRLSTDDHGTPWIELLDKGGVRRLSISLDEVTVYEPGGSAAAVLGARDSRAYVRLGGLPQEGDQHDWGLELDSGAEGGALTLRQPKTGRTQARLRAVGEGAVEFILGDPQGGARIQMKQPQTGIGSIVLVGPDGKTAWEAGGR